jgi:hypothetical protein
MRLSGPPRTNDKSTLNRYIFQNPHICERLMEVANDGLGNHRSDAVGNNPHGVVDGSGGIDTLDAYMEAVTDKSLLEAARAEQSGEGELSALRMTYLTFK